MASALKKVLIGDSSALRRKRWEQARDTALERKPELALAQEIVKAVDAAGEIRTEALAEAVGRPGAAKRRRTAGWRDVVDVTDETFDAAVKLAVRDGFIRPKAWSNAYRVPPSLETPETREAIVAALDDVRVADVFLLEDLSPRKVRGRVGATLPWSVRAGEVQWLGPRTFGRGELTRGMAPPARLTAD